MVSIRFRRRSLGAGTRAGRNSKGQLGLKCKGEGEREREKERERERREGGQGVMREFMGRDEGCSLLSGRVFR